MDATTVIIVTIAATAGLIACSAVHDLVERFRGTGRPGGLGIF